MNDEICTCKFCNTEIEWGGADDQRGAIWSCEECGELFCQACFDERHGHGGLHRMANEDEAILCPDCYAKHN
jgi:phage terminase large subunit GpA-like protein